MARDRTVGRVGNRTHGTDSSPGALAPSAQGGPPEGDYSANIALLERFARCLETVELENEVLTAMGERLPGLTALVSLTAGATEPSRVRDREGTRPWRAGNPAPPLLAAPVVDRDEAFGWIAWTDDTTDESVRAAARALLPEIAAAAAIPARNAHRYAGAIEAALKDGLTGVYNRRAFEDFLARETEAARRYDRPLSLIVSDVDRFKEINDTWGHPAGDHALCRLARVLEDEARRSDMVARIGGDEFALIVRGSDAGNAVRIGERIVARLARLEISPAGCEDLFSIGASFGVADLEMASGCADRLVEMADRALLAAKRAGGGSVTACAAPDRVPPLAAGKEGR